MVEFNCILCGKCCEWYWIPITHLDMLRLKMYGGYQLKKIVDLKNVDEKPIKDEFIVMIEDGEYYISLHREEKMCIFLEDGKCLVHKFKPLVCRFYPFLYIIKRNGGIIIGVNDEAIGKCPGLKVDSKNIPKNIEKSLIRLAKIRILELSLWRETIKSWNNYMGKKGCLSEFINFSIDRAERDFKELHRYNMWTM
ncbi:MAG: YkgJ family cysteine cluster protein [Candidatus Methanomethylicia archaeon]